MPRLRFPLVALAVWLPAAADVHHVPLFPSVDDPLGRQGFVRVINESNNAGSVIVEAIDEAGVNFGSFAVHLNRDQARHFNSEDVAERVGTGATGHWRLRVTSETLREFSVLAYLRSLDGFLAPVTGGVARYENEAGKTVWPIMTFNPARNTTKRSFLRITNLHPVPVDVDMHARDDLGATPDDPARIRVDAGATRTLWSDELEEMWGMSGSGKWRLEVVSSYDGLLVLNVLESVETGHFVNMAVHRVDVTAKLEEGPTLVELGLPQTDLFGPLFAYRLRYADREQANALSSSGSTWVVRNSSGHVIGSDQFHWDDVVEVEFNRVDRSGTNWADQLDGVLIGGSVIGIGHTTGRRWDEGEACWIAFQVEDGVRIKRHVDRGSLSAHNRLVSFSIAGLTRDPFLSVESETCTVAPDLSNGYASYLLLPQ